MKIKLIILFLFSIFLFGCKKYPEDENLVHFKRFKHRLKEGSEWKITEYKVDGADSLSYASSKNIFEIKIEDLKFEFDKYGSFHIYSTNSTIYFSWQEDKNQIKLGYTPNYPLTYPLFLDGQNIWEIKRMDHKVFTIETGKNSKTYRVTFTCP